MSALQLDTKTWNKVHGKTQEAVASMVDRDGPGAGLGQLLNELQLPFVGSKKLLENPQDAKSGVQEFVCMGVFLLWKLRVGRDA